MRSRIGWSGSTGMARSSPEPSNHWTSAAPRFCPSAAVCTRRCSRLRGPTRSPLPPMLSTRAGSRRSTSFLELAGGRRELEARVAPSGPNEVTAIIRDFTAVRAVEAEVRRSRARILEATDQERQRLERDLHDGAQQRLVSVSLALRRLRGRLAADSRSDVEAVAAADEAASELKVAIQELRELARGIHPAILTEAGLGAAINALADRSAVPATVRSVPDRRLPAAVEATSYFVVSEALANVAKHAGATSVSIAAVSSPTRLRIEVGDDGVGG